MLWRKTEILEKKRSQTRGSCPNTWKKFTQVAWGKAALLSPFLLYLCLCRRTQMIPPSRIPAFHWIGKSRLHWEGLCPLKDEILWWELKTFINIVQTPMVKAWRGVTGSQRIAVSYSQSKSKDVVSVFVWSWNESKYSTCQGIVCEAMSTFT